MIDIYVSDELIRHNGEICKCRNIHRDTRKYRPGMSIYEFPGFLVPSSCMKKMFKRIDNKFIKVKP